MQMMAAILLALVGTANAGRWCDANGRGLIMTADPGGYSGVSEAAYVYSNMTDRVDKTTDVRLCAKVTEGFFEGVRVTLVTTGIGAVNAASCMTQILEYYEDQVITDVIYMGTSGWTPRKGGFYNPEKTPKCKESEIARDLAQGLTGIGDVCISTGSFLQRCGFCSWDDTPNAECTAPTCTGHNQTDVFGDCVFSTPDKSLADSLVVASQAVDFVQRPEKLQRYMDEFWALTWKGFNVTNGGSPAAVPRVYGGNVCAEATEYNLWTGMPQDYLCRKYLAEMITTTSGTKTDPSEVTCVSAMEGAGWMRVLLSKLGRNIPFANVRGASDYVFWPMQRSVSGQLVMNPDWLRGLPGQSTSDFITEGYRYAVGTISQIVRTHYAMRC